jgi:hypothetical protein
MGRRLEDPRLLAPGNEHDEDRVNREIHMNAKWMRPVSGTVLDILLASGILASLLSVVLFVLLSQDYYHGSVWMNAAAFFFAAGLLYTVRHFRRRAYGLAEVGFAIALFAYTLYVMRKPDQLLNLIFQTAAAIYVAIRGFDNIVLFHKNK